MDGPNRIIQNEAFGCVKDRLGGREDQERKMMFRGGWVEGQRD